MDNDYVHAAYTDDDVLRVGTVMRKPGAKAPTNPDPTGTQEYIDQRERFDTAPAGSPAPVAASPVQEGVNAIKRHETEKNEVLDLLKMKKAYSAKPSDSVD